MLKAHSENLPQKIGRLSFPYTWRVRGEFNWVENFRFLSIVSLRLDGERFCFRISFPSVLSLPTTTQLLNCSK